jgi:hypothetical protein
MSEVKVVLQEFPEVQEFLEAAESKLVKVWKDEVATYFIISRQRGEIPIYSLFSLFGGAEDLPASASTVFHCGYVVFTPPPFESETYHDVEDVDVHGGVTWGKRFSNNVQVYGFDCAHYGDEYDPRCKDMDWLTSQCEQMGRGILELRKGIDDGEIY